MILTAIRDGIIDELAPLFRHRCILEPNGLAGGRVATILLVADWEDKWYTRPGGSGRPGRQIGIIWFDPDGVSIRCHRSTKLYRMEYCDPNLIDRLTIEIADCVDRTIEHDDRTRRLIRPGALAGTTPRGPRATESI